MQLPGFLINHLGLPSGKLAATISVAFWLRSGSFIISPIRFTLI